jgi:hypothetical protein
MAWEKLTTTNIVQLIGGVGAVILGVVITFIVNAWQNADLRYEEGQFHRSGSEAIISLKIHNYGYSDAKDILIATNFPKPLVKPPVSSDDTYPCSVVTGGKGEDSVSVSVKRLVPNQSLYLYYAIEDPKKPITGAKDKFVSSMTYEGGQGKDGPPLSMSVLAAVFATVLTSILVALLIVKTMHKVNEMAKQRVEEAYKIAKEAVGEAHKIAEGAAEDYRKIAEGAAERYHKITEGAAEDYQKIATKAVGEAKEAVGEAHKFAKEAVEIAAKAEAAVQTISAERDELRRQLDQLYAASGGAPAGEPAPVSETSAASKPPPVASKPKKK